MPFNTAIFYDIENLLKGYSSSQQMAANLSLEKILGAIKQTEQLSQIAVQRAYANWSDPRLAVMRGEINELGIEPIQVFGFSRDQKKNAADIQLAIDAIDLAHVRPSLEVFVIVSGDGGFASLAKKLHEYGKTVIGCAYRSAANKIFQAVCDAFVWITAPDEEEHPERDGPPTPPAGSQAVTEPQKVPKLKASKSLAPEDLLAKAKEVLNWYASDATSRADLAHGGISLNVVLEAVRFAVPGFQSARFGFPKFSEYLQYACKGSRLCVARSSSSQAVLAFRSSVQRDADILPDLDVRDLQTADGYRSLLSKGTPILRLLPADEFVVHFPHYDKDPLGPASTVLLGDYKLIRVYETGQRRLFDVAKDPGERLDLAEAMPDKVKDLDARLTDYLQSVHAQIPTRNPNFDPSKAVEPTPLRKQKKDTKGDRGRKGRAT